MQRWLVWPLFAFLMGFALGGSFVWGVLYVPPERYTTHNQQASDKVIKNGEQTQSLWVPTDSVGLYTLVLAVFTGLLVAVSSVQGFFLLRSDKTARIAANAADLSARAAVALELPIIRVVPDAKIGWDDVVEGGIDRSSCYLRAINLKNAGRTKAFPIEILWGWTYGDQLPSDPIYAGTTKFETGYILMPDIDDFCQVDATGVVPADGFIQLRNRTARLWFYCELIYLDFMDIRHTASFCWERLESFGRGRFVRDETPSYNRKT